MRHQKKINKLGRDKSHRKAMVSNMASSLILSEYIVTTRAKAKICKSFTDKVISFGKKGGLHAKKEVEKLLGDKLAASKVIKVLVDRYNDRIGGYVSIVHIGNRKGDNSKMSKLILVGSEPIRKTKKKTKKASKKKTSGKKDKAIRKQKKEKQNILDKVKTLRNKFKGPKDIGNIKQKKDQVDKHLDDIKVKSRSGL